MLASAIYSSDVVHYFSRGMATRTVVHKGKWLQFEIIEYLTSSNKKHKWEMVSRTTRNGIADAIEVIAVTKGQNPKIVLVEQFRPPLGLKCIEFPAGLVDANETNEAAALRELKEETGYIAEIKKVHQVTFNDPGLTNSNTVFVHATIDGEIEENKNPKPNLQDEEDINVYLVHLKDLLFFLNSQQEEGKAVDGRLFTFALGLGFSTE